MLIESARKYIGCKESDGSFAKIINKYNMATPLPRGYRVKLSDSWCATFVSVVLHENGLDSFRECSCEQMIARCKAAGKYIEDESITPQPDDLIFFNFTAKKHPNTLRATHVGIVESVANGVITTIEGNYGDAVKRRKIAVGSVQIRGYARITEGVQAASTPTPTPAPTASAKRYTVATKTDPLRLRSSASTRGKILARMPRGSIVKYAGETKGDWLKVTYNGVTGYASATYLKEV